MLASNCVTVFKCGTLRRALSMCSSRDEMTRGSCSRTSIPDRRSSIQEILRKLPQLPLRRGRLLDESEKVRGGLNGLRNLIRNDRLRWVLPIAPAAAAAAASPRRRRACHCSRLCDSASLPVVPPSDTDMTEFIGSSRPLFGGALSTAFPDRFQDVSNVRQVPDHQEVFVDPSRDESLIFELLELKHDVADQGSAAWFLQDLATEQDAGQCTLLEQSGVVEAPWLVYRSVPAIITTAIGQMAVSKGRQGRDAQNVVRVYLANLRLKEVNTDMLITAYEPILINPLSESATTVGSGLAVPAAEAGVMPMAEVFKLAVSSFKVQDWSLFGHA